MASAVWQCKHWWRSFSTTNAPKTRVDVLIRAAIWTAPAGPTCATYLATALVLHFTQLQHLVIWMQLKSLWLAANNYSLCCLTTYRYLPDAVLGGLERPSDHHL